MIRPARDLDAGPLGAILSEFVETNDWVPRLHTRAQDIAFAAKLIAGHCVFVWSVDRPVGFIGIHQNSIDALYVRNDQHRQGYGSALIQQHNPFAANWIYGRSNKTQKRGDFMQSMDFRKRNLRTVREMMKACQMCA